MFAVGGVLTVRRNFHFYEKTLLAIIAKCFLRMDFVVPHIVVVSENRYIKESTKRIDQVN